MRMTFIFIALVLGTLLVVGSSGNFRSYSSTREVAVTVVPHDKEYLGFTCDGGYAAVVTLRANSYLYFDALNVTNNLLEDEPVSITLYPDYSGLPGGLDVSIETDDGNPVTLVSGEEHTFQGYVIAGNVAPGEYVVPVSMGAVWDGGGASISTCPIKIVVVGDPTINKTLLSGNTSDIPMKTFQRWTFRIEVTNPAGEDLDLTIADTIPAEFNVSLAETSASSGSYSFSPANGGGHGYSMPATKMEWNVTVPAGGSEHIDVMIFTRVNNGNQQEFTSCGDYPLNNGAEIKGYGIVSNGLNVSVSCEGGDDP
ncbi:hypothetical protein A3K92_06835 [Thermococcus gorgonarius]|uniref:DUF11 domain-containing protein n=2 Tax=Thermococcus gorgonarius TaxID=71997 RepID=A0A2Z2M6H2_THEGO|nr:hypothetical protein A3K92_06835 [Thermococcus gorgonarius]